MRSPLCLKWWAFSDGAKALRWMRLFLSVQLSLELAAAIWILTKIHHDVDILSFGRYVAFHLADT
jgi:hypothetical protein